MTDATAHRPLKPFTVDHWRKYTRLMRLDSGLYWIAEDWQNLVVEDVFKGMYETWLVVPEGNGKTTLMGGVALYHGDHQADAAVAMAASSRDQCGLLLGQASGFVRRSPGMSKRFRVFEGYRKIKCHRTGGVIQVYSADERTGDGAIYTLALVDELHRHKDLRLYRVWSGKDDKREGQLVVISTAGEPRTEFEDVREAMVRDATDIHREGRYTRAANGGSVMHEYALKKDDDPEDLDLVLLANPFSGITRVTLARARAKPSWSLPHWKRFKCNVATRTELAAIGDAEWSAQAVDGVDIPIGSRVDVGLDLGWKWDTTALVPLWDRRAIEVRREAEAEAWVTCFSQLNARQEQPARFLIGVPTIIVPPRDGNSLAPAVIEAGFIALDRRTPINKVVMDPSAGGEQLAAWLMKPKEYQVADDESGPRPGTTLELAEAKIDGEGHPVLALDKTERPIGGLGVTVVVREQTPLLQADAAEHFMEGLRLRDFQHCNDPRLNRQVLNGVLRMMPGGQQRFDRPAEARNTRTEDRREIDGLVSASMVYTNAIADGDAYSVYQHKELLVLG